MFNRKFWPAAAERAVKTGAQVLVVFLGADAFDVFGVDWRHAAGITLGAVVASVVSSVASAKVGDDDAKGTPSLVGEE